jgi:hypothetical protein
MTATSAGDATAAIETTAMTGEIVMVAEAATIAVIELTEATEVTGATDMTEAIASPKTVENVPNCHLPPQRNSAPSTALSRSQAKASDSSETRAATSCSILRTFTFRQISFGSTALKTVTNFKVSHAEADADNKSTSSNPSTASLRNKSEHFQPSTNSRSSTPWR